MDAGLYSNSFSEVFSKILENTRVSCYQIHSYTNLDQAYLSRLKNSQKINPSPETIMKISLGLVHCCPKITLSDIDNLFKSVGRSLRA